MCAINENTLNEYSNTYHVYGKRLTAREIQVLREYAVHGGQKDIAFCLDVSVQTVKNHLTSCYGKLGAQNVVEAFGALGWLELPDDLLLKHTPDQLRLFPAI